jgi:hypothetical protein
VRGQLVLASQPCMRRERAACALGTISQQMTGPSRRACCSRRLPACPPCLPCPDCWRVIQLLLHTVVLGPHPGPSGPLPPHPAPAKGAKRLMQSDDGQEELRQGSFDLGHTTERVLEVSACLLGCVWERSERRLLV